MEDRYTRIEDYLDGVMPESDRAAFEQECLADAALAADLALVQEIRAQMASQMARAPQEAALRTNLKRLGKQHFQAAPAGRKKRLPIWWPALAAVFVGLLVWVFWPAQQKDLYAAYKNFPKAAFTQRSANGAQLSDAERLFNAGDYRRAAAVLHEYLSVNPEDAQTRLFLALCQLETGEWDECRNNLNRLAATGQTYQDEADWYLAMSYLKAGDRSACEQMLGKIDPQSRFFNKARALQQELTGKR